MYLRTDDILAKAEMADTLTRTEFRTLEQRIRRIAQRRGLALMRNRRRDPRAWDYGGYMLISPRTNGVVAGTVAGHAFGFSLADVARYLLEPDRPGETTAEA